MLSALGIENLQDIFENVDILFVSRPELEKIFGSKRLKENVQECFNHTPIKLLVVTLGSSGSAGYVGEKLPAIMANAYQVKVKDTTGAGDAFISGFFYAFLKIFKKRFYKKKEPNKDTGCPFKEFLKNIKQEPDLLVDCLKCGNAAAALTIQETGARNGQPSIEILGEFMKNNDGISSIH
ncbi:MAG: carbohydrate kinase family protein, partial [Promethearchaeota archaeon]